ncbi:MAG TPA: ABC transporter ATP-binding protein, partial [Chloroflexota bacterium]|nr:ABC transporter ATP-binding protein [Chloroflexota bacterium]
MPDSTPGSTRALLAVYLAPRWRGVLAMAVLLLLGTALQLLGPQVVRGFLDAVQGGAGAAALHRAALLFLVLSLLQQGARVLAGFAGEGVAWSATNALRADLVAHLLRLDLGFHKARTPGELIERVDGDAGALAGFFSAFSVQLAGSALLLLGIVGAVSLIDPRLGLAFALFAVAATGLLGWVRRAGTPAWRLDREQSAAHYGFLGEALGATEDLRASGAEAYAMDRFFGRLRRWWPVRRRAAFWEQAVMMAAIVAFAGADALAYGLGGALYGAGAISLGTVYAVVAYAAMLAAPIETLRTQLQDLQKADAALARVRELLAVRSPLVAPH